MHMMLKPTLPLLFGVLSLALLSRVQADDMQGVIIKNVPPKASAAYDALKSAARSPDTVDLEMTGTQMWRVPREKLESLKAMGRENGMSFIELGSDSNRALVPVPPDVQMTEKQSTMMHDSMRATAAMGVSVMELPDPAIMEYALTKCADRGCQDAGETDLKIPLDADTAITVRRTGIEKTHDGYIWHGVVVGSDDPVTLLWWPPGRLSGQITYRNRRFVVKNLGGTMHGVVEMSPRKLPPEHAPMDKSLMHKMQMRKDPFVTEGNAGMLMAEPEEDAPQPAEPLRNLQDARPETLKKSQLPAGSFAARPGTQGDTVTIDLLVAYTPQAARHYTDIERDLIDVAVAEANQSFRASGLPNVRLRVVHTAQADYTEEGTHFDHVFRLARTGNGYMDEMHALRDKHKADVVALIVHDPNGCGLSAGVAPPAKRAFAVVHHECAALSYSLTHEIGHIIGARHDIGLDDTPIPYPYGHGYVHGKEWRTIMSYEESCDSCPRLPIWSTPTVRVRGVAAGNDVSDNARVISQAAGRVAAFR
jgi:hypothetical protein